MSAKVYKAPQWYSNDQYKIFLAGSIDMGTAEDWQREITAKLAHLRVAILNPRRDDWDDSWKQDRSDERFVEQVQWELEAMENAQIIIVHFTKDSFSPITLLELGLHARSEKQIVYCPDGFYRKGNVDVVCGKYDITQAQSLDEVVDLVEIKLGR